MYIPLISEKRKLSRSCPPALVPKDEKSLSDPIPLIPITCSSMIELETAVTPSIFSGWGLTDEFDIKVSYI